MNTPEAGDIVVAVVPAISDIGRETWDACLGGKITPGSHPENPFLTYDFLEILEVSGCVCAQTGWLPQHLCLKDKSGQTLAVMPAYLKSHSMGEYVFDHGWARAFEVAGGEYYPKLQCSVPFTPVSGPRVLVKPGVDRAPAVQAMAGAIKELTRRLGASSAHVTFVCEDQWRGFGQAGFLKRTDRQFHWHNDNYADFDAFLAGLTSRKRKAIRKERARAMAGGIEIELLTGDEIRPRHWDIFHHFYLDTAERKWGSPYLNRQAFEFFGTAMAEHILLVMARQEGRYIAGALNFIGAERLFGRYWGCLEAHDFLHFEVCYYRAMDYAIETGLTWIEAGAQGEHKLMRGYMPMATCSAHHIRHPDLARAVEAFLDQERHFAERERRALAKHGPYRNTL